MKRYLFISNSSKLSEEKALSIEPIVLDNIKKPCVDAADKMGYEIWVGTNRKYPEKISVVCDYPVHLYHAHTYRNLFAFKDNIIAYKNCMAVLKHGDFDVIHCNTPIGGIIGRFCGRKAKVRKIIYTAHGFHFYKGAPLFNRTILKWAEMLMAHWTDAIITMNQEDYEAAQKFKLRKGGKVYYVPGVGIDTDLYRQVKVNKSEIRSSLGLKDSDIVCISAGDLIPRKNYGTAIKAVAKCPENVHYLICGRGSELNNLETLARENGVENRIHFLGFRADVKELMKVSDIFLFTTLQEGMPRSMMEAMASGLPCIASKIRGNIDLLMRGQGGYLVEANDVEGFAQAIREITDNPILRKNMQDYNLKEIKKYDLLVVKKEMASIYNEILGE